MKTFLRRVLVFGTPLIVYLTLVAMLDPYGVISDPGDGPKGNLAQEASGLNQPLFKLAHADIREGEIFLFGDSRTDGLGTMVPTHASGKTVVNLAFGGATLHEMISAFWAVVDRWDARHVEAVYIGLELDVLNDGLRRNRVPQAIKMLESYPSYLTSREVLRAIMGSILHSIRLSKDNSKETSETGPLGMTQQEFWRYTIESTAVSAFGNHVYPDELLRELETIAYYCDSLGIDLYFFLPPTHVSLQERIADFGLEDTRMKLLSKLGTLGKMWDCNRPSDLTKDSTRFRDPYHLNSAERDSLSLLLFGDLSLGWCIYYPKVLIQDGS